MDGTWTPIGPKQFKGSTVVGGVDNIPPSHMKFPLTVQVNVTKQATTGYSYVELDYVGSLQTNKNTGGDSDNDNDSEMNDQDQQSDGSNNQNDQNPHH
jgi:hypothetical protein